MKAIALISGGLDSVLAAKVISEQGIEVIGVTFITPFSGDGTSQRVKLLAKILNIDLRLLDISAEFFKMLKFPKHGYGKNLNPCIDCRMLELRQAHQLMKELGASFVVTGEVLGQRPMSQNRQSIELIERESGMEGLIVRALCAKLFSPSIPEKEGWINREELLDIEGRSRKKQYKLAGKYNISGYGAPAGGCLLTDSGFSLKVKNLMKSNMLDTDFINLMKTGRYFSLSDSFKLVVGRDHKENLKLLQLAKEGDIIFEPASKGPVAIGRGKRENAGLEIASRIVAYYCKNGPANINVKIFPEDKEETINAEKISGEEILKYRV
ncbi:tRNA 4-thiouridine(8) synthase ThiI [bacterium]|nr:tRNA 4-thiouridine(8) synthase ThiI [bacterium]